jgi:hypothetical protein
LIITGDTLKIIALTDLWILGFFDILNVVCSTRYQYVAEIKVGAELTSSKAEANRVRSAFWKLQVPGKGQTVFPGHRSNAGPQGTVYAVVDEDGRPIDIARRQLADEFLQMMADLPPSPAFQRFIRGSSSWGPLFH